MTWVALGLGWRLDAATLPGLRRAPRLGRRPVRVPGVRLRAARPPNFVLDGDTLLLGDQRVPLRLADPRPLEPGERGAGRRRRGRRTSTVPLPDAAHAVDGVTTVAGRYMQVPLGDGRTARVLLAKNPAGWSEVLAFLAGIDTAVVLAVNARVADGKDPSWLWDVPYELLRGHATAASGERCLDVAVRLRYAEVDHLVDPDPLAAGARPAGRHRAPRVLLHPVLGPLPTLRGR